MRIEQTCKKCQTKFHADSNNNRMFCSRKCYAESTKEETKHKEHYCLQCSVLFINNGSHKTRKYCSHECYWKSMKGISRYIGGRNPQLLHGMSKTRFYRIWHGMNNRCKYKSDRNYHRYGGRGITVENSWKNFKKFHSDMFESYTNHAQEFGEKETSLDRVDNNRGYSLKNCRWATHKEQSANARIPYQFITYKGKTKFISEWADVFNISRSALHKRIVNYKWDLDKAFTQPVRKVKRKRSQYAKEN